MRTTFVALVPVKSLAAAKSRLREVGEEQRRQLSLAFASDVVAAALATPAVGALTVVTRDAEVGRWARDLGAHVLPDAGDLNASLRRAALRTADRSPSLRPVVLCADLPGLDAGELEGALAQADDRPAIVPDHQGTGTTLYTAPPEQFDPRFGPGSRAAHRAGGARELAAGPGLRRDVDTRDDLDALAGLGLLGAHTRAVLAVLPEARGLGADVPRPV